MAAACAFAFACACSAFEEATVVPPDDAGIDAASPDSSTADGGIAEGCGAFVPPGTPIEVGHFEGACDGFVARGGATGTLTPRTAGFCGGGCELCIGPGDAYLNTEKQLIVSSDGGTYEVNAWLRPTVGTPRFTVGLDVLDMNDALLTETGGGERQTVPGWQRSQGIAVVPSGGNVRRVDVALIVFGDAGDCVTFDELSVVRTP